MASPRRSAAAFTVGLVIAHNTHVRTMTVLNCLNDIGSQLVVVSPQTFVDVVDKFFRIAESPAQIIHYTGLQHVIRTVALTNAINRSLIDGSHHVALGFQVRTTYHRTKPGNDSRFVVREF